MNSISQGSLFIALIIAFLAGVTSFLSPCVLPLVPGYLSFITGFGSTEEKKFKRSSALIATFLFILGFSLVFVSIGMFFGSLGGWLIKNGLLIERIFGFIIIILGLNYLGIINIFNRQFKIKNPAKQGIFGAPILGIVFAIGWTPCIGPTLAAVQSLAFNQATIQRGAILSFVYALGLGLPFLILTLIIDKSFSAIQWLRIRQKLFINFGGILLIILGLLLVSGLWSEISIQLRILMSGFSPLL